VSGHTPGPWRCVAMSWSDDTEAMSGEILFHVVLNPPVLSVANATLVEAGPELLAACKAALIDDRQALGDYGLTASTVCLLEKAIAKAEGK